MAWDDLKSTLESRPDVPDDKKLTAAEWNAMTDDQQDHSTRHEQDGSDELDVSGLSGVLADAQSPQTEAVQDIVGALVTGGTNVTVTYDDTNDVLTVDTSALNTEEVEDAVGALVTAGNAITVNYDDGANTLSIGVDESALSFYDGANLTAPVDNQSVSTEEATINGPINAGRLLGKSTKGYGILSNDGVLEKERLEDPARIEGIDAVDPDGTVDVFLLAGQSNALGFGGDATSAPSVSSGFAQAYHPPTSSALVDLANTSASDLKGTILPEMVNTLNGESGRDICIVQTAEGGSALDPDADNGNGNWSPDNGTLYGRSVTWTQEALSALGSGARLRGVIWIHGTRDAKSVYQGNTTATEYRNRLRDLIDRWRTDFDLDLPALICPTVDKNSNFSAISNAQAVVAATHHRSHYVDNSRSFSDRGLMADDVHYNQTGLTELGAAVGRESANLLLGRAKERVSGGSTSANESYTGAPREVTADVDRGTLRVHNGRKQGGYPVTFKGRFYSGSQTADAGGNGVTGITVAPTFDPVGIHDRTNTFSAPVDGSYTVSPNVTINPAATGPVGIRYFNSTTSSIISESTFDLQSTNEQTMPPFSDVLELNEGDEFSVNLVNGTGSDIQIVGGEDTTWITIER